MSKEPISSVALQSSFKLHQSQVENVSQKPISSSTLVFTLPINGSAQAGPSTWRTPGKPDVSGPPLPSKKTKSKLRTTEEINIIQATAKLFATRLAADHAAVLHPDVDNPFADTVDAVNRLLPYHVYQQPQDDLDWLVKREKGKRKATELEIEVSETKFALQCHKRLRSLQNRFRQVRTRAGKYSAPGDQSYALAQAVLDSERTETAWINSELRNARTELEKVERDRRTATAATARTSYYPSQPATAHSFQWYQPYPYAFAQPYHPPTTAPPAVPSNPALTATSSASIPVAASVTIANGAASQANSTSTAASTVATQSTSLPIPVQLPVVSLPALHALGITPVPVASIQPGQPSPVAVLRGASANGTILSLEINVSGLTSAQMNGLAMILNSIMARGAAAGASSVSSANTSSSQTSSVSGP